MSELELNSPHKEFPFSYHGRYGRLSYIAWSFILSLFSITAVVFTALLYISILSFSGEKFDFETFYTTSLGYFFIALLIGLIIGFTVLLFNITIRRLHDLNKSGWLSLLAFAPFVNLFFWIYVCCFKGTDGANSYGEKHPTSLAEVYLGSIYGVFLAIYLVIHLAFSAFGILTTGLNFSELKNQFDTQQYSELGDECVGDDCYIEEEYDPLAEEAYENESVEDEEVNAELDAIEAELLAEEERNKAKQI